jgi:hypothetical protein
LPVDLFIQLPITINEGLFASADIAPAHKEHSIKALPGRAARLAALPAVFAIPDRAR